MTSWTMTYTGSYSCLCASLLRFYSCMEKILLVSLCYFFEDATEQGSFQTVGSNTFPDFPWQKGPTVQIGSLNVVMFVRWHFLIMIMELYTKHTLKKTYGGTWGPNSMIHLLQVGYLCLISRHPLFVETVQPTDWDSLELWKQRNACKG